MSIVHAGMKPVPLLVTVEDLDRAPSLVMQLVQRPIMISPERQFSLKNNFVISYVENDKTFADHRNCKKKNVFNCVMALDV